MSGENPFAAPAKDEEPARGTSIRILVRAAFVLVWASLFGGLSGLALGTLQAAANPWLWLAGGALTAVLLDLPAWITDLRIVYAGPSVDSRPVLFGVDGGRWVDRDMMRQWNLLQLWRSTAAVGVSLPTLALVLLPGLSWPARALFLGLVLWSLYRFTNGLAAALYNEALLGLHDQNLKVARSRLWWAGWVAVISRRFLDPVRFLEALLERQAGDAAASLRALDRVSKGSRLQVDVVIQRATLIVETEPALAEATVAGGRPAPLNTLLSWEFLRALLAARQGRIVEPDPSVLARGSPWNRYQIGLAGVAQRVAAGDVEGARRHFAELDGAIEEHRWMEKVWPALWSQISAAAGPWTAPQAGPTTKL